MFYSQFILAKKGPLGTIWIAAHLERKLRKNQVADTDIGVSVDSILCPDVPIALRLSSHLLLGVVRIYNRKVNYLFDDCSEALLKVKQAFRSTAVDLPPEQSKAPYHSITLPETFDLDDFELPDSDIHQGNYVDHHVSSKEQITLQDTMEGAAYSTTLFGLDERFGDGDTSGVDLDEELLLAKVGTSAHADASTDPQASDQTMEALKEDVHHEGMTTNLDPTIDGVGEDVDLMDNAQAPRTPGLIEEPNLSNVQETSACDDHFETEDRQLTEFPVKVNFENISGETDIHQEGRHVDDCSLPNDTNSHTVIHMPSENGYHSGDLDMIQLKPEISSATEVTIEHLSTDAASTSGHSSLLHNHVTEKFPVSELADKIVIASDTEAAFIHDKTSICAVHESDQDRRPDGSSSKRRANDVSGVVSTLQQVSEGVSRNNYPSPLVEVSNHLESVEVLDKSRSPSNALDVDVDFQGQTCQEPQESRILSFDVNEKVTGADFPVLRPCNANVDQPDLSNPEIDQSVDPNLYNENATPGPVATSGREETSHASEKITGEDNMRECNSDEGIHAATGKADDKVDNRNLRDSLVENVNSSAGPDLPAPEKLLSVTDVLDDLPRKLIMESTPGDLVRNDDGDAGSSIISGKKRSYAESTMTEQSLNSVESSRIVRSKRTVDSIPDDDDLLSSILVGRKSSILKVKATPSPWEMTFVKRSYTPRAIANKRKVLMDDNMVLHGDTIRQQLMDTEDIRRVRKKAPCTRPEISKIQKQFLEDDMFMEPVYTGVSVELIFLHNQAYDLSGIRISVDEVNCASLETATDVKLNTNDGYNCSNLNTENAIHSSALNLTKENEMEATNELLAVPENGEKNVVEAPSKDENKLDEDPGLSLEVNTTKSLLVFPETGERDIIEAPMDENKLDEDPSLSLEFNTTKSQMNPTTDVEPNSSLLEPPEDVTKTDIDGRSNSIADGVITDLPGADEPSLPTDQVSGDPGDTSADLAQVAHIDDNSAVMVQTADNSTCQETLYIDDAPCTSHDQRVVEVSIEIDATGGEIIEGNDIAGKDCDIAAAGEDEPRTGYEIFVRTARDDVTVETAPDAENRETKYDSHGLDDKGIEHSMMDNLFLGEVDMLGDVIMDDRERPTEEVVHPLNATDDAETSVVYDHDATNYSTVEYETEFLNVDDDDEVAEPTDDNIPNEEVRLVENSGWSSRTRAVANYLQTLYVKQAGNARPTLSMDNLLVGKTRKEASRMFFEALVLKTRDYIHVEQENPFQNIAIKPRTKLMKSDF